MSTIFASFERFGRNEASARAAQAQLFLESNSNSSPLIQLIQSVTAEIS